MCIYYNYASYGTKIFFDFFDDCVFFYKSKALGKWLVENLGKIFNVNFLVYAHWFISIRISQLRDHYVSVYQDIYATSIVDKYLATSTVKTITKFIRPLCHMI